MQDVLEIVPAAGEQGIFTQSGIAVPGDRCDNLVVKALHLLQSRYKLPEMDIYLRKNIPFGAGLGGGSSDASFMLKSVNDFARLNLSVNELEELALTLGADCPFFIRNKPVFAEGIGNLFSPVEISLKDYYTALIKPDVSISTREAYANVGPRLPDKSIREIIRQPVATWKDSLVNDFEAGIFARYPEIREAKEKLYRAGAVYASMSGSGSAVFGLFETKPKAADDLFIFRNC
jgi:4-diphosphocytidyl-2-C-methyl-D-erythritol kinase